eukprot:gi/632988204/ref/XP_007882979.1/ PREDICTED: trophoblast glycoprotein-like [Callorhinchus milii]
MPGTDQSGDCPRLCTCEDSGTSVECRGSNLTHIPLGSHAPCVWNLTVTGSNIPSLRETSFEGEGADFHCLLSLCLDSNNIREIGPSAFRALTSLENLTLNENPLAVIAGDAFAGLSSLRSLSLMNLLGSRREAELWRALESDSLSNLSSLYLAGSGLTRLPGTVPGGNQLHVLDLRRNCLPRIGEPTLTGWRAQNNLRVSLLLNPLVCDCQLSALYWWVRNASQSADGKALTCYAPENLNGSLLSQLRPRDLACATDTASYVVFGAVLAIIAVMFLMVLYLNRKGIQKWLRNIQEACHDQMEVYDYRFEQDSDPRLSSLATIV